MFSRIFSSARALLTDPAQTKQQVSITYSKQHIHRETMVTSRSQSRNQALVVEDEGVNDDNTINVYVSSGKKRAKRGQDAEADGASEEGTPSAKKRKRLPVREKEIEAESKILTTRPVVEIPARKITPVLEAVVAGRPGAPVEISDDEDDEEEVEGEISEEESEHDADDEHVLNKESRLTREEIQPDTTTKHKRFDDSEPGPEFFSTAKEALDQVADSEEDDEDSEDDAPEAIGIQEAAKEVKSKERNTAKAVKEQLFATRKKRKERDEVLKKQSETGKKRKMEVAVDPEAEGVLSEVDQDDLDSETDAIFHSLTTRSTLPDFLPASYLSDTEPDALVTVSTETQPRKKAQKTKFLDAASKAPKDRRIGDTIYRVSKAGNSKLVPKSSFRARDMKEKWLQGRSGKAVVATRRPFGKTFARR